MTLDLTPEQWDALELQRRKGSASTVSLNLALDAVLTHRPKPVLEDGIYRDEAGAPREVIDGKVRGTLMRHIFLDPAAVDTSGWTRLRVLADDEVAVRLPGFFVAEDGWRDPVIWREREGRELPVLYRHYATGALFDALAAALPHRDDR